MKAHSGILIKSPTVVTRSADIENKKYGEAYKGIVTGADIFVKTRNSSQAITRPLIVVEGFDPRSKDHILGITNFQQFIINLDYTLSSKYDIIYVDWENSEEYIQANANTLKEIILWVNKEKKASGSNEPNIIWGQSMGGLVARYALKTMENEKIQHETSFFISHDAPHLGANVPLGILYSLHGIMSFMENKSTIGSMLSKFGNTGTLLQFAEKIAHCNAARQMLVNYVDFAGNLNNLVHNEWQQELAQLGFPQGDGTTNFRMLCIANGSYQAENTSDPYLDVDFSASSDILNVSMGTNIISSAALGILLQDIWAGLLNMLPGKSTLKGAFKIAPGTSIGKEVANMKVKFVKKYFWLVDIPKTLFSYQKNMSGGLCYDNFPSAQYHFLPTTGKHGGVPIVGYYDFNIKHMADHIPFLPTSSALCAGGGTKSLTTTLFTTRPNVNETPFGANVYIHDFASTQHISMGQSAMEWMIAQLDLGIIGPKLGITGSQYSVPGHETANIQWSTSSPEIASISADGRLTAKGKGVVTITARVNNMSASKEIIVGTPRFVLDDVDKQPGFNCIKAKCIDTQPGYAEFIKGNNDIIAYVWGIKSNDEPIKWMTTDSPELHISILEEKDNTTVYLKTIDMYGNESAPIYVKISGYDVWKLSYYTIIINKKGEVFDELGEKMTLKYATMSLTFKQSSYDGYNKSRWNPLAAVIVTDDISRGLPWYRGTSMTNIITESDIQRIITYPDNSVIIFKLVLLNFNNEVIQRTPISILYKANFTE